MNRGPRSINLEFTNRVYRNGLSKLDNPISPKDMFSSISAGDNCILSSLVVIVLLWTRKSLQRIN